MKCAIITVAGMSNRFNEGIPEEEKALKAIYTEGDAGDTLLYHLLRKCAYTDRIIVVGGYRYNDLKEYCEDLEEELKSKLILVYNKHYEDLASGYSLYLGLREAFKYDVDEVLFVEGDLDIDDESFTSVVQSKNSVLTYTFTPIYADKAVVLYRDAKGNYQYVFNSDHGLLSIETPFSCMLNSGQTWKFTDMGALRRANDKFASESLDGTNLVIIQNYLDEGVETSLIALKRWYNCNTRKDFKKIKFNWEEEK